MTKRELKIYFKVQDETLIQGYIALLDGQFSKIPFTTGARREKEDLQNIFVFEFKGTTPDFVLNKIKENILQIDFIAKVDIEVKE